MEEEDEDFYAPEEHTLLPSTLATASRESQGGGQNDGLSKSSTDQKMAEDLEEGEEEEEEEEEEEADESDSDIDIITERKDSTKPEPPAQTSRHNAIRNLPARKASSDLPKGSTAPTRKDPHVKGPLPVTSGADYPEVRTSNIDVDHVPVYKPAGKSLTEVDIDEDLKDHDKPWRVPGTDVSDYFNYGFDEFTWTLYCLKQEKTKAQAQVEKKEFTNGMMMGGDGPPLGMPGLPALPSSASQPTMTLPPMPGIGDIPPEMQAMMAQMMASGMDPSQLAQIDPSIFGMQQASNSHVGVPGGATQGQAFGSGPSGFGSQGQAQQQMGFAFDPSMMGVDAGRARSGNFAGRGRGGNRRNW